MTVALMMLALGAGCGDNNQIARNIDFTAPYDLALVDDLLFVISSDEDELNVLDLAAVPRVYVPAPNPLEPLAIPVLSGPVALAVDTRYDAEGDQLYGPYVYAQNPGLSEISVVSARREDLREVLRVHTEGPVTAISAEGPQAADGPQPPTPNPAVSTLYYAIATGAGSEVRRVVLSNTGLTTAPASELLLTIPGEFVSAMVALPRKLVGSDILIEQRLVIATRANRGRSGRTFTYTVGPGTEQPLAFPYPVRMLRTHGASNPNVAAIGITAQQGTYVFGVLDEAACGGGDACRGILAVNVLTGALAADSSGETMLPIRLGHGNPVNLLLVPTRAPVGLGEPDPLAQIRTSLGTPDTVTMLGIIVYATGLVGFFDAGRFEPIDADICAFPRSENDLQEAACVDYAVAGPVELQDPNGNVVPTADGGVPFTVSVSEGKVRDEQIAVIFQGRTTLIPHDPLVPVSTTVLVDPALLADCPNLPSGAPNLDPVSCRRILPGDTVTFAGSCTDEVTVVSTGADRFELSAVPVACTAVNSFTVRAGTDHPFTVVGSVTGYLGRAQPTDPTFRYQGPYLYHEPKEQKRPGLTTRVDSPQIDYDAAAISFSVPAVAPPIARDYRYLFSTVSHYAPLFTTFEEQSQYAYGQATGNNYPGGIAYRYANKELFLSLPAGRAVLQMQVSDMTLNGVTQEIVLYR